MATDFLWDVVALGEAMIEFNQADLQHPQQFLQGFGGDTSNALIAAARQGARTAYITRVGDDVFGQMLLDLWQREAVCTDGVVRVAGQSTGIYVVTHGAKGHEFTYARAGSAASRMLPEDLPWHLIQAARFLHVSGISQAISESATQTVQAAITCARQSKTLVAYDPNVRLRLWTEERARAVMLQTLPLCDWFLPSIEDLSWLSGHSEPEDLLSWCADHGCSNVILKMGPQGYWLRTPDGACAFPAKLVEAVDATGAGDCFDGAFLARMAAGDAPPVAAAYANAAAALTTQGFGAVAPLPRPAMVRERLAQG